ncbi:MAG: xanthine dehydrogenase family protein subunit M [Planctomycetes bacterium]|nr:xanthine dehydrogenase family protein subunit M [Planctomycetota bacterium]
MKAFILSNPKSVKDALQLLAVARDSKQAKAIQPLAGGQDLLTEMKEHLAEPDRLVNLKGIAELDYLRNLDGKVQIGALATLARMEKNNLLNEHARVLFEAAHSIASPQIRSVGTIGGNLNQRPRCLYYRLEEANCLKKGGKECFAYSGMNRYNAILGGGPSYIVHPSDLAPALIALDATVFIAGRTGPREMPLESYYKLPSVGDVRTETVREPDELLLSVSFQLPAPGTRSTYLKFKERESYDFALASVALVLGFDGDVIRHARLVLGGVAPVPWRVRAAEAALVGQKADTQTAEKAAELALAGAVPLSGNAFKIPLTKSLIVRAIRSLA